MNKKIIEAVAKVMAVPVDLIMGKRRTKQVALARQIAMYFVNRRGLGVERTGVLFNRHHSNISYATNRIEQLRYCDYEITGIVTQVEMEMPELRQLNHNVDYQI